MCRRGIEHRAGNILGPRGMDWEKPMTNIALESEEFAVEEELHTKQMVLAVKT